MGLSMPRSVRMKVNYSIGLILTTSVESLKLLEGAVVRIRVGGKLHLPMHIGDAAY